MFPAALTARRSVGTCPARSYGCTARKRNSCSRAMKAATLSALKGTSNRLTTSSLPGCCSQDRLEISPCSMRQNSTAANMSELAGQQAIYLPTRNRQFAVSVRVVAMIHLPLVCLCIYGSAQCGTASPHTCRTCSSEHPWAQASTVWGCPASASLRTVADEQ
jgi:hypothetical protein